MPLVRHNRRKLKMPMALHLQSCGNIPDIMGPNEGNGTSGKFPCSGNQSPHLLEANRPFSADVLLYWMGTHPQWRWLRTKGTTGCSGGRAKLPIKWQVKRVSPWYSPSAHKMRRSELPLCPRGCRSHRLTWECQPWMPGLIIVLLLNEV